ncbi:MAG: hypothetical protein P8M34_12805 [Saprospiraceae bacterium]|nr:hypothetical protein [Saprospiraceae bacterium]|tara:strand:+ start:1821 stop:2333 length:513 start_codon:yes stop_codon:yes gene_type:complete
MIRKVLLLIIVSFLSCTKDAPTLFRIEAEAAFVIAPGLDNIRTHIWPLRNIRTNIGTLASESTRELVDGIYANTAVVQSPFVNFDFRQINMASINIWDPQNPEDKREVFFMDRQNNNRREELQLFSSLSEVKDILLNDTFDAEVKIRFLTFTPTEIESRLIMNFVANGKR